MTAAHVEPIEPDPWLAATFLERARQFQSSAAGLPAESRQVLLHHAVIAACDAVLAIEGLQIRGSEAGHKLRIDTARGLLGGDDFDLFDVLDESRQLRNNVSYAAGFAVPADVDEIASAVHQLLARVALHVEPHLPKWRQGSAGVDDGDRQGGAPRDPG